MESRKQAILDALNAFVRQRSGIDYHNYSNAQSYRAEQRSITRDLHHYRELAAYVSARDSITADMLLKASRSGYSGRLTLKDIRATYDDGSIYHKFSVDYTTGQYFPTEYRRAACVVLAAAIWEYWREQCMPAPTSWRVESWARLGADRERSAPMQIHAACELLKAKGGSDYGHVQEYHDGKTPGDWLRANARREFGRGVASRWFQ